MDDQVECVINEVEFMGWKVLYTKEELKTEATTTSTNDADGEDLDNTTYSVEDVKNLLKVKPKLTHIKVVAKQVYSRSLCRYTEASLIKDLESKGIGRPSTYANIMETIIRKRNYVEPRDFPGVEKEVSVISLNGKNELNIGKSKTTLGKEKKKLSITPLGENVVKFLIGQFSNIINYDFTKKVEDELDLICDGRAKYETIVDKVYKTFHPKVVELKLNSPEIKALVREGSNNNIHLGDYDNGSGVEKPVFLKNGPYGHYLSYDDVNYSLKYVDAKRKEMIITSEDIEEAVNVIEEQVSAKEKREQAKLDAIIVPGTKKLEIRKGPYGYYFQYYKKNYGIGGDRDPTKLTEEDCMDIVKAKKEWLSSKSSAKTPADDTLQTKTPKSKTTTTAKTTTTSKTPKSKKPELVVSDEEQDLSSVMSATLSKSGKTKRPSKKK